MSAPTHSSQLLIGITHREMVDMMVDAGISCGTDKFARILRDAQQRALNAVLASDQAIEVRVIDGEKA